MIRIALVEDDAQYRQELLGYLKNTSRKVKKNSKFPYSQTEMRLQKNIKRAMTSYSWILK